MKKSKITILITGGTIDSVWDGSQDTAVVGKTTILPDYFLKLKLYDDIEFKEVCMKDSRALNADDRKNLLKTIEESSDTGFIITHGTYTMPDTAKYLQANIKRKDAVVILTGSMVPLKGFEFSDGGFNLGYALSQVKVLSPGIYVAMNGRTFQPEEVAKDLSAGKFYSLFSKEN